MIRSAFNLSQIVQFAATCMFILIFAMACSDNPSSAPELPVPDPTFGAIEVEVITTGDDDDPDGYTISIQGGESKEVDPNSTVTFTQVATGNVAISISEIPVHCQLDGDDSQSFTLGDNEVKNVQFDISCGPIFRDKILFMRSTGEAFEYQIYSISPDGENMRMVSDLILDGNASPVASPDGLRVLFSMAGTGSTVRQIYVMNADGSGMENLSNNISRSHLNPVWSPDGTQIAYSVIFMGSTARNDIFVMDADGSNPVNITNNPDLSDTSPSWSPDGNELIFSSSTVNSEGSNVFSINKINADGSGRTMLLEREGVILINPKWSPAGDGVAFERFVIGGADGPRQIHRMNVDGSNIRNITADGGFPNLATFSPSWSPDGRHIAFYTTSQSALNIFIMTRDGVIEQGSITQGRNSQHHIMPSWSPFTRNW